MKKRYLIPAVLISLLAARVLWVSRPEPPENAELTDTCEYPGISNTKYRELIAEAKALLAPYRETIKIETDYKGKGGGSLPTLARLTQQFVAPSNSTSETVLRMIAIARALDGRVGNRGLTAMIAGEYSSRKESPKRMIVGVGFQAPIGTLWYGIGRTIELRLYGRRYDQIGLSASGPPLRKYASRQTTPDDLLPGDRVEIVDAGWESTLSVLINGAVIGDARIPRHCPDIDKLIHRRDWRSLSDEINEEFSK